MSQFGGVVRHGTHKPVGSNLPDSIDHTEEEVEDNLGGISRSVNGDLDEGVVLRVRRSHKVPVVNRMKRSAVVHDGKCSMGVLTSGRRRTRCE